MKNIFKTSPLKIFKNWSRPVFARNPYLLCAPDVQADIYPGHDRKRYCGPRAHKYWRPIGKNQNLRYAVVMYKYIYIVYIMLYFIASAWAMGVFDLRGRNAKPTPTTPAPARPGRDGRNTTHLSGTYYYNTGIIPPADLSSMGHGNIVTVVQRRSKTLFFAFISHRETAYEYNERLLLLYIAYIF